MCRILRFPLCQAEPFLWQLTKNLFQVALSINTGGKAGSRNWEVRGPQAQLGAEGGPGTAGTAWSCASVFSSSVSWSVLCLVLRPSDGSHMVPSGPHWIYVPLSQWKGDLSSLTVVVNSKMVSLRTDSGHLSIPRAFLVARGTEASCQAWVLYLTPELRKEVIVKATFAEAGRGVVSPEKGTRQTERALSLPKRCWEIGIRRAGIPLRKFQLG